MSDFDARRQIKGSASTASTKTVPRKLNLPPADSLGYVDLWCIRCGEKHKVMPEVFIVKPEAMTDEGYICPACLRGEVKPKTPAAPPPKGVQMRIDDVMKGAAGR